MFCLLQGSEVEKWVLGRRRSQLVLRNKAAHADMGSRKGIKNVKIKISALRHVFASERKKK